MGEFPVSSGRRCQNQVVGHSAGVTELLGIGERLHTSDNQSEIFYVSSKDTHREDKIGKNNFNSLVTFCQGRNQAVFLTLNSSASLTMPTVHSCPPVLHTSEGK